MVVASVEMLLVAASFTAPGTVDDKDAWRAQQAAKEKSNEALIGEVKTQLKAQEEQNKKLAQALENIPGEASGRALTEMLAREAEPLLGEHLCRIASRRELPGATAIARNINSIRRCVVCTRPCRP